MVPMETRESPRKVDDCTKAMPDTTLRELFEAYTRRWIWIRIAGRGTLRCENSMDFTLQNEPTIFMGIFSRGTLMKIDDFSPSTHGERDNLPIQHSDQWVFNMI